jgi:hypothetical protein
MPIRPLRGLAVGGESSNVCDVRRKEPERMENSILPKDSKGLATELEGRISLNLSWRAGSRALLTAETSTSAPFR